MAIYETRDVLFDVVIYYLQINLWIKWGNQNIVVCNNVLGIRATQAKEFVNP